jgi:regulator of cell morphogenesis and NO signaling
MKIIRSATLAEIASDNPSWLRVLESLGLDYFCGGQRTIDEACRQQDLDAGAVIDVLEHLADSTEAPAEWLAFTPVDFMDHLETTHHHYLKLELPRLEELAAKVSLAHGASHLELDDVAATVAEIHANLKLHLRKQEDVFFPMIRTLASASTSMPSFACGSIRNSIALMEAEHKVVGELLVRLRELTCGYQAPADTCTSTQELMVGLAMLEADIHLHVHKENNHLFPAVIALEEVMCS